MEPLQLFCEGELVGTEQVADEDVGVRQFGGQVMLIRDVHDLHLRPTIADGVEDSGFWTPLRKIAPDTDD